jgi:hypothetical protein
LNLVAYMWYCGDHPSGVESSWWWGKNIIFWLLGTIRELIAYKEDVSPLIHLI